METKRPTSPAAEEILGGYFPVLDHGFVALVDYMGGDEDIERAARVSYGYGTRKVSRTRGLIRYLRRHWHTTPSEMVELKFHCAMPMFVARQWIRHRTACLAEGTEVYFDLPGGIERRGNQLYKLKVEEIWERFQSTANVTRPDKQRNPFFRRERVQKMHLRQMNEDSGAIQHTRVVDVYRNGPKPVFRMVLSDGKTIEATADHRFRFSEGWATLTEATGLREVGGKAVWDAGDYFLHVNGMVCERPALYQDRDWLEKQYSDNRRPIDDIAEDCGVSYHTIRKWLTRHGLTDPARGRFQEGDEPWNKGSTYELGPRELSDEWIEADESLAREEANLTTLCGECHRTISGNELEWVERLGGPPVRAEWKERPRVPWNSLETTRLVRIERFEYVGVKETYDLEVEGPYHNFVANGIVTHNSVNEYSGRYSLMPLLFYRPEMQQFALQSEQNNQGREAAPAEPDLYRKAVEHWERVRAEASEGYRWMVAEDVARELARIDLPLSTYTQWYWKIDLHNLFHFLTLRADPHAQWEIQEFARVMAGMLKRVAPLSYEAWIDYNVCGAHLSRAERDALRALLEPDGEEAVKAREGASFDSDGLADLGMSGRERREFVEKIRGFDVPDYELDLSQMRPAEEVAAEMQEAVPEEPE